MGENVRKENVTDDPINNVNHIYLLHHFKVFKHITNAHSSMCQLLGMNCSLPTDFCFSFSGFRLRGGLNDVHSDGFGIAIYQGRGLRTFTDTLPAAESPLADMISKYPIKTLNMMAHIRYATQGHKGDLANVHPFHRELWGIHFCFCHNGDVAKFGSHTDPSKHPRLGHSKPDKDGYYIPVGDTDSEAMFCAILNALRNEYDSPPTLPEIYKTIQMLCEEIVAGEEDTAILNFLLCCGEFTQFAYSWPGSRPGSSVWNGLFYTIREPPFTSAELTDVEYTVDFSKVTTDMDRVAVITTKPLTKNETWVEMKKGELLMFDKGLPYGDAHKCHSIEEEGRGLCSKLRKPLKKIMIPTSLDVLQGKNQLMNRVLRDH